jgi:hypothetical protein
MTYRETVDLVNKIAPYVEHGKEIQWFKEYIKRLRDGVKVDGNTRNPFRVP